MEYTLAIDQSTSATKAVLFDPSGRALDSASREHQQHYPRPGWVEHDAGEIWHNTLEVCSQIIRRRPQADIAAVSIANQRETVVVFDRATGEPLHPAIVWQCRRGAELCAAQISLERAAFIRARTGLRVDSYFSASKLQWLIHNRSDIAARLNRGEALIGTIDTYLIYRLTGGTVFATDHTNASRTLLYDIGKLQWDEELCAWWDVPRGCLAEVLSSDTSFGATTLEGLLGRSVPIRGVMGDSQAALFAHGCHQVGAAKVTFGTGSSVLLNAGHELPGGIDKTVTSLAWVRDGRPTYALEGIITCSAATLNWLRDQLGILITVSDAEALARQVSDDEGVYVVPAFSGLGAPYWREGARAAIIGLTAHSDRRHVIKAALESMAYQVRDILDMMYAETGVRLREIHADGGPARNAFLMQFVADIVGVDLRVTSLTDQSAWGAALMGRSGTGEAPGVYQETTYERVMTPEKAQSRYQGWLRAVGQVLSVA
jgi:glycerol kinase